MRSDYIIFLAQKKSAASKTALIFEEIRSCEMILSVIIIAVTTAIIATIMVIIFVLLVSIEYITSTGASTGADQCALTTANQSATNSAGRCAHGNMFGFTGKLRTSKTV